MEPYISFIENDQYITKDTINFGVEINCGFLSCESSFANSTMLNFFECMFEHISLIGYLSYETFIVRLCSKPYESMYIVQRTNMVLTCHK